MIDLPRQSHYSLLGSGLFPDVLQWFSVLRGVM